MADHRWQLCVLVPIGASPELRERGVAFQRRLLERLAPSTSNEGLAVCPGVDIDEASAARVDLLFQKCWKLIPRSFVSIKRTPTPWITEACLAAVHAKSQAVGTARFSEAQRHCTQVLTDAYKSHLASIRGRSSNFPRGSKRWWVLCRSLLGTKQKVSSIPPLEEDDNWSNSSKGKAPLAGQVSPSWGDYGTACHRT